MRLDPQLPDAPGRTAVERLLPLFRVIRAVVPLMRHLSADDQAGGGHRKLNPGITRVLSLLVLLVYTCHWMGCVWWCVGELEQDGLIAFGGNATIRDEPGEQQLHVWGPSIWLRRAQPLANQYAHAFLWGAGMMTGFVPKDVTPNTLPEVIVTILALFFGLVVNTAIISSTTSALQVRLFSWVLPCIAYRPPHMSKSVRPGQRIRLSSM